MSTAFVRVVAHDAASNQGEDLSDAAFTIAASTGVEDGPVARFGLGPAIPNPSHGITKLEFTLPEASHVRLTVYDLQGREVAVLARGRFAAGRHVVSWRSGGRTAPPSGLYFVRLEIPGREGFVRRVAVVP